MYKRVKTFIRSPLLRHVVIVASGAAGAQIITIVFTPLITRLYGPEAFGLLGTYMALLAVLTPMAALTYPIAIVLAKEDAEAECLAKMSIMLACGLSTIVLVIILIYGDGLASLLSADSIKPYLWLIPFVMTLAVIQQVLEQWLLRKSQFKVSAQVAILQSVIINSAKTGAGVCCPAAAVLIILQTIASGLNALLLWIGLDRSTNSINLYSKNKFFKIKEIAFKYKEFPLYRAPQVFLFTLSQSFPVLMLAFYFGPASAGFYSLARTVMGIPVTLVSKSVGDVFYPKITQVINNNGNAFSLILNATIGLSFVGFIPFVVVILMGPAIFGIVFGDNWLMAGEYARWIAAWLFFGFLNRPSIAAIPVLNLQRWFLNYEILSTTLKIISLVLGFLIFESDLYAIALMSISGAVAYCVLLIKVLKVTYMNLIIQKS